MPSTGDNTVKLNDAAMQAIHNSDISGPALVGVFEKMAQSLLGVKAPGGMLNLNYLPPGIMPEEGDLIPVITLALRPFRNLRPARPHPPVASTPPVKPPVKTDNPFRDGPAGRDPKSPGPESPCED